MRTLINNLQLKQQDLYGYINDLYSSTCVENKLVC